MVVGECLAVERCPDLLPVRVLFLRARGVSQLRVSGSERRNLPIGTLPSVVDPVVWIDTLPEEQADLVVGAVPEAGDQVQEPTSSATRQVRHERFQRAGQELQRVFEDDVLAPADGQVLLQPLPDDVDLLLLECVECQRNDVTVVSPEVVEEYGDLVCLPELEIAPVVRRSSELSAVVVVVPDLVFAERSVTDVTDGRCV